MSNENEIRDNSWMGFCPYCGKRSGSVLSFEAWAWCDEHRVKWHLGTLQTPIGAKTDAAYFAALLLDAPDLSTYEQVRPVQRRAARYKCLRAIMKR